MTTTMGDGADKVQDSNQQSDQQQQKQISIKIPNNVIVDADKELLGSVTTNPSGNDGQYVRTSARVISHKLRMDSTSLPPPEKKETQGETSAANPPKTPSQTKTHVRVQWSNMERTWFFDALNEYGRDFEQISRFINLKMKRKTPSEQDYKTNFHIRQLYSQCYQKASKYLRFSDDVPKNAQELYTLINYGEMKRKLVMSSEKSFLKLRDLVYKGSATIRLKGKNIKVKTPSCRALRKLNQLEGKTIEDVQLPQRIDVVLRPANMKSWGYVQSLAQNPRIRMASLPLQKRLATLLHTIQQKWQTSNGRLYEKYVSSCIQQHGPQRIGEGIVAQSQTDTVQLKSEEPVLRFMPPRDTVIHRPMVQLNQLVSNICLNSYEDRIGAKTRGETLSNESFAHIKDLLKHPSKRMRFDSASEKNAKAKAEEQNTCKTSEEVSIASIDHKSNDSTDADLHKKEVKDEDGAGLGLNLEPKKDEPEDVLQVPTPVLPVKPEEVDSKPLAAAPPTPKSKKKDPLMNGSSKASKEQTFKPLIDEETLRKVRKGWTLSTVDDLTIGDLYLMFGSDGRLVLEYEIVDKNEAPIEPDGEENVCKVEGKEVGSKLKSLLLMANLLEGSPNPTLLSFLSSHSCERNSSDSSHAESSFKQPFATMAPRLKPNRWRQQHCARSGQLMAGVSGNHVVRDIYLTPPTVESQPTNNQSEKDDEVTKMLEAKISGFNSGFNFTESSQSSMRSLLENFAPKEIPKDAQSNDSSFSMKLLEEEIKQNCDDDKYSVNSLSFIFNLGKDVYDNSDQGI